MGARRAVPAGSPSPGGRGGGGGGGDGGAYRSWRGAWWSPEGGEGEGRLGGGLRAVTEVSAEVSPGLQQ